MLFLKPPAVQSDGTLPFSRSPIKAAQRNLGVYFIWGELADMHTDDPLSMNKRQKIGNT